MLKKNRKNKLAIFGGSPVIKNKPSFISPLGREEIQAARQVVQSGKLSFSRQGYFVKKFEKDFSHYFYNKFAISTTSGTTALHAALSALAVKPGDEILVPALTFVSSASVILQEKARPVFVDVIKGTFNFDPKDLERKITKKSKAIIVVHLYGLPADMTAIMKIAKRHDLKVIEDCAQAPGAKYRGKYIGSFGDLACFSFQQTKNMTCGEGGMVTTDNEELYRRCAALVDHGLIGGNLQKYDYDRAGYNYHLTEIQAAIGLEQLKKLAKFNIARRRNVDLYKKYLSGLKLYFQKEIKEAYGVYYFLTVLLPQQYGHKRNWFIEAVRAENAEIFCLYPLALTQTSLFSNTGKKHSCPRAENIACRLFNLPVNPGMKENKIINYCQAIKKVLGYIYRDL